MSGREKKPGRPSLSERERALFDKAMADVKPLKRGASRALEVPAVPRTPQDAPVPDWMKLAGPARGRLAHPALEAQNRQVNTAAPSPQEGLDRRTRRGLTTGRQAIDRTIDLHGLNQEEAFAVLVRTIERAVSRDMKTVLVITGKGGRRFQQLGDRPASERTRADFSTGTGVLKRMVPLWLSGEALTPFVESYASASPSHGGEGALYVRLRRRKSGGRL